MSSENFLQFYKDAFNDETLKENFRAVTSLNETVKLGQRHGYSFDVADARKAMMVYREEIVEVARAAERERPRQTSAAASAQSSYHYDFKMDEIPGFEKVAAHLENLKIRPDTVDLNAFHAKFVQRDFETVNQSPVSAEVTRVNDEIAQSLSQPPFPSAATGYSQRDVHLVNLDLNVEHAGYEAYFAAKVKMVRLLSEFFGSEIKFSGGLWYPSNGYRLWHTNEAQPGWRMYLTDFDQPPEGKSFFRYMHPNRKQLVTLKERPRQVRFFRVESRAKYLFWHCIANTSAANRWSFGFVVPDNWMSRIAG